MSQTAVTAAAGSSTLASVEAVLLAWFERSARELPWRRTTDPYEILVAEVMLQQYGVENVETPALQPVSA